MAQVKRIESKIKSIEGFGVRLSLHGRDVRGDRADMPPYPARQRMANDGATVAAWKKARFLSHYAGYDVDVLDANGEPCPGNMKLATVRAGYK